MEAFQIVESYCNDIMCIVQKSQMQHSEFFAGISFAHQMSRSWQAKDRTRIFLLLLPNGRHDESITILPISHGVWRQHSDRFVVFGETINGDTNLKALVESLVVRVVRGHLCNQPQLLRIRCHQWCSHHKRPGGQYIFIVGTACVC